MCYMDAPDMQHTLQILSTCITTNLQCFAHLRTGHPPCPSSGPGLRKARRSSGHATCNLRKLYLPFQGGYPHAIDKEQFWCCKIRGGPFRAKQKKLNAVSELEKIRRQRSLRLVSQRRDFRCAGCWRGFAPPPRPPVFFDFHCALCSLFSFQQ